LEDYAILNVANEKYEILEPFVANLMALTVVGKIEVQVAGPPDPEEMQPTWSFETSANIYQSTCRNVPEDFKLHLYYF
jgi:hypothetical protein